MRIDAEAPAIKHVAPHGEVVFRQCRGFDKGKALGYRQTLQQRRDGVLGISTAREQRTHRVSVL